MHTITLPVEHREQIGKGPARRLRALGKAPAIFYGKKSEPIKLAVNLHEFKKIMEEAGSNPIFDLKIENDENAVSLKARLKERQVRPVDGAILHLDFQELFMDELIDVTVRLEFEGKPVGVEKGGMFQIIMREVMVSCLPGNIPDVIKVSTSALEMGHSIHVSDLILPEGVTAVTEPGIALATITAPKKGDEGGPAAAAAEEK